MTISLTWSPGWQASSGVMSDASSLFNGGNLDTVTAYGNIMTGAALTMVLDLGSSVAVSDVYLGLSYMRNSAVLIESGTVSSGTTTVTSMPFIVPPSGIPGSGNTNSIVLSIPAGTYSSATWKLTGSSSGTSVDGVYTASDITINQWSSHGSGSFTDAAIAATSQEMTDINASAGSTLSVLVICTIGVVLSSCTLTLVLTGASMGTITWSTATVSQWAVWPSAGGWTNFATMDTVPGVWTWASNHGTYGGGTFRAAVSLTTRYLRISVSDTAAHDTHINVNSFNVTGSGTISRSGLLQGGILITSPIPGNVAAIVANDTLAATA